MSISVIVTTNTFRDWFNKTNEIITALNEAALVDGVVANGAFTVNGSILVKNTFLANSSLVWAEGNTKFSANVSVTSNCNVWNFACGTLLIQPLDGTFVNTDITINGLATFQQVSNFGANVFIVADASELTGNLLLTGTLTANGPTFAQYIAYAAPGALVAPANLTNPQYDDYQPTGGDVAQVWNLTPTIDTVLTGLAAPTGFLTGSRVLYIQNLSPTYKISLVSANTSSQTNNRFKTPGDVSSDINPGGAVGVMWSSTNHQWRILAPVTTSFSSLTVAGNSQLGNTNVTGWMNVSSSMNVVGTLQVAGNSQLGNTNVTGWMNVSSSATVAGTLQVTGNSQLGNTNVTGWLNVSSSLTVAGLLTAALNASALSTGTVPDARFPATLPALSGVNLTALNAGNLGSGTVPDARFPATLPAANGVNLTTLNASNLGSGTLPSARFPATLPAASGVNLTALNATNLGSGTVPDARFPAILPAISGQNLTNLNATNLGSGTVPLAQLGNAHRNWAGRIGAALGTIYHATRDTLVTLINGSTRPYKGYSDASVTPTTEVFEAQHSAPDGAPTTNTFGVKSGDYWYVTDGSTNDTGLCTYTYFEF